MSWPTHTFRGVDYTFEHLKPFRLACGGLRVHVKMGAHVFCKEAESGDPNDLKFMDGRTVRTFCPIRYGMSLSLPQMLAACVAGYVYEGKGGKFLFKQSLPSPQGIYLIAFQMWPSKSPHYDVTMQINSAHNRPFVKKARFVKFDTAVAAVTSRQSIPWIKK
jgi:hypothetical protein